MLLNDNFKSLMVASTVEPPFCTGMVMSMVELVMFIFRCILPAVVTCELVTNTSSVMLIVCSSLLSVHEAKPKTRAATAMSENSFFVIVFLFDVIF